MDRKNPLTAFRISQNPQLTKAGLAKLLGVSRSIAHRWESGERRIGLDLLPTVSEKTGIPRRELRPDLAESMEEAQ